MKKILVITLTLFLVGFISAVMTGSAVNEDATQAAVSTSNTGETQQIQVAEQIRAGELGLERVNQIQQTQNRLRINATGECPANCTCDGSSTKCAIESGREMTISAGNSGNTIVQIKNQNMSTNVELYKTDGKVYGVFSGNQTRAIEFLPDQIREKIQERLRQRNASCEIELNEDGTYSVQTQKRARLFGLFAVNENVNFEIDSETGEIINQRNPWWGFLASDEEDETSEENNSETEESE